MNSVSNTTIQQVENLNRDYICALDSLDMPAWLACFNLKGRYTFISEENERRGFPIAFMLDDCYERLQDRVTQVVEIQSDSTEHYQMRHFTQLISVSEADNGLINAVFNYSIYYTQRDNNLTKILCVGQYFDTIKLDGDSASYIERKAVTDTNVLPRYTAYPV
jgi:3-phenylpropionate/cinnamic acid dioxygenase small subunit|tara:strand:- start:9842 stop:10330 length:489 start_codon:yes stop_codon:yes gene_type:complete